MAHPSPSGVRQKSRSPVAVIGGGLAGLSAAYRCAQAGMRPVVFEAAPTVGGMARAISVGGEKLDALYHHIFTSDDAYISMARELRLEDSIEWLPSKMGVWTDGRAWDFGTPISLLKFGPLRWIDKSRFAFWTLFLKTTSKMEGFEHITAKEWVMKHMGERVWRILWGPLLRQKFGSSADEVAMVWLWRKISLRGKSRSASGMGERLGYMKGAFVRLALELARRIVDLGGRVETGRRVRQITRDDGGCFEIDLGDGSETADRVLAAVSPGDFLQVAGELLAEDEFARISRLKSTGALCTVCELSRSLSPYYWLNIADDTMPFGGLIEHTNFIPASRYRDRHILYISKYLAVEEERFSESGAQAMQRYLPALKKINPEFDQSWILDVHHFRVPSAQPVVLRGYSEMIPPMKTSVEGLFFCTMAQIYPEDRGQNYAISYGEKAARILLKEREPEGPGM